MSCCSVLLVEETGGPGENHQPAANNWETLSHNAVSSTPCQTVFENTILKNCTIMQNRNILNNLK